MYVILARNVHAAIPLAAEYLEKHGLRRESRNGPVRIAPEPVTTVYTHPLERVVLWPQRDANPFFHLYESLWMIAGRDDLAPLLKFTKQIAEYSDDDQTLHGAYGYRWRHYFNNDQLSIIAERLRANPDDRRCVLQMWNANADLGRNGRDVPCNLTITFQRDHSGRLDMVVFNRSNDVVWGAYGANAVHFSMLQEYLATWIGCPVGTYSQVSVNFHAYEKTFPRIQNLPRTPNPYTRVYGPVNVEPMPTKGSVIDLDIKVLLDAVDRDDNWSWVPPVSDPWLSMVWSILKAHWLYRTLPAPQKFMDAKTELLKCPDRQNDWFTAAWEWIIRREVAWVRQQFVRGAEHLRAALAEKDAQIAALRQQLQETQE